MYQYTTPYHRFKLPVPVNRIAKLYISYGQYNETLFEKSLEDCEIVNDYTIRVRLSQEETGKFQVCEHSNKPELQVTLVTDTGNRITSDPVKLSVGKAYKSEVI